MKTTHYQIFDPNGLRLSHFDSKGETLAYVIELEKNYPDLGKHVLLQVYAPHFEKPLSGPAEIKKYLRADQNEY